jgi:hypothetical protein
MEKIVFPANPRHGGFNQEGLVQWRLKTEPDR